MNKNCLQCNTEFEAQRSDAKFCSSTCRAHYWTSKNSAEPKAPNIQSELRGLLKSTDSTSQGQVPQPKKRVIEEKVETLEYKLLKQKISEQQTLLKRLSGEKQTFINRAEAIKQQNGFGYVLAGASLGALIANASLSSKAPQPKVKSKGKAIARKTPNKPSTSMDEPQLKKTLIGAGAGFLLGSLFRSATHENREAEKRKELGGVQKKISDINTKETFAKRLIQTFTAQLGEVKQYHVVVREELEPVEEKKPEAKGQLALQPSESNEDKRLTNVYKHQNKALTTRSLGNISEKIINSTNLDKLDYAALNFQDKWQHLFGYPSIHFHCVIHGKSGEGKSTFAIQFANYLAENFGVVIYISGEEGFSKTLKDKFKNNKAQSESLYIADLRSYQDVMSEIAPDTFNFIFIDSLDNMRIGVNELKELRKLYAHSALITISQSTKDGKMRGSYEIVHDSDIAVSVENGIAVTSKNRFKEKGTTFTVFETRLTEYKLPKNTFFE